MTRIKQIAITMFALLVASGCTLITDFDDPGNKYSMADNLSSSTVAVTLSSTSGTGTLTMSFTEALPEADDAALLALLEDATITVEVTAAESDVNADLTDGTRVDGTPAAAGEYSLTMAEDRMSIGVTFYNEYSGTALHSGGTYTATFSVLSNKYFKAESFSRTATVN